MTFALEAHEPCESLPSDEVFQRSMKMSSLALLRAIENARGLYPLTRIKPDKPRPEVTRPIFGEALGQGIIRMTAAAFNMPVERLKGRSRRKEVVHARAVAIKLLYDLKWGDGSRRFSYPQIGRMLGRDHSTIIHSLTCFDIYCRQSDDVREIYAELSE